MLYVGVDPGEQWCGVAVLDTGTTRVVRAESRVYAIKQRGYIGVVDHLMDILPHARRTTMIVEDYRVRGSGHQRFGRADTLRMIGALEYAVHQLPAYTWAMIAPGSDSEVRLLFANTIDQYRARWPETGDKRWRHCFSAWRVLGRYLMGHQTQLLKELRSKQTAKTLHSVQRWLPTARKPRDLIAPAMAWKSDQKG